LESGPQVVNLPHTAAEAQRVAKISGRRSTTRGRPGGRLRGRGPAVQDTRVAGGLCRIGCSEGWEDCLEGEPELQFQAAIVCAFGHAAASGGVAGGLVCLAEEG
jgi:hypothetical protein